MWLIGRILMEWSMEHSQQPKVADSGKGDTVASVVSVLSSFLT
jgi:hypothetical protein